MNSGIINIYKEKDYTSHDVVNIIRKELNRIKTGHTGTLDPNAEGVIPICIGKATKISEYIATENKEYKAEVILGLTTDTLDITGSVLTKQPVFVNKELIVNVVNSFVGKIKQVPPMYSAIKIGGRKLYDLAREGKEIEREARDVEIYSAEIVEFIEADRFVINVSCSKGTYIRTLCDDIGKKLNCGGVMGELTRTRTGNFYIKDSMKLAEFKERVKTNTIQEKILPIEDALPHFKKIYTNEGANKYLANGNKVNMNFLNLKDDLKNNEEVFVYNSFDSLIGIYVVLKKDNMLKPIKMLL